jgi:hypothetical protein
MNPGYFLQVLSLLLVATSLWFVGVQSRSAAKRTQVATGLAVVTSLATSMQELHAAYGLVLRDLDLADRLLPVGREETELDPERMADIRVRLVAQMLCDAVESAFAAMDVMPEFTSHDTHWRDLARHVAQSSPAVMGILTEHPLWYPHYRAVILQSGS